LRNPVVKSALWIFLPEQGPHLRMHFSHPGEFTPRGGVLENLQRIPKAFA